MTTSDQPLGKRDLDEAINPDTGLPKNMSLSHWFDQVVVEPGEASRIFSFLGELIDPDGALGEHLRWSAHEVGNPENYDVPPTTTKSTTTSSTSSTSKST